MADGVVKAALVGCGRVAQHYASLLSASPIEGLEIVATCDPVVERAEQLQAALGGQAFASFADALRTGPDLALVLTPSGRHHIDTRTALEAGCHVVSEKPITLRPEHAESLIELAASRDLLYGVVFQNRYNPAVRALRDAKLRGRFSTIVSATIRLRWSRDQQYYEDGWHGTWAQDGGVISQQAIHHVDALDWICGPITAVCAATANRANELEAEDTLVAAVRFGDGSLGTIEATTAARPRDVEASLSIVGTGGVAQIGGIALNEVQVWELVEREAGDDDIRERASQQVPNGYGLSHLPYLAELVDRLRSGSRDAPVTARDGIRAVEVIHALYASAEQGGWVELADKPRASRLGLDQKEEVGA